MIAAAAWRLPRLVRDLNDDDFAPRPTVMASATVACRVTTVRVNARRLASDLERELRRLLTFDRLGQGNGRSDASR